MKPTKNAFNINTEKALKNILTTISKGADSKFSGIGLILYDDFNKLPVTPLRKSTPRSNKDVVEQLISISDIESPFHDGFHLIDKNLRLTHTSNYFSPPIVSYVNLQEHGEIGGRYAAALYGSFLDGIILTCVITSKGQWFMFKQGVVSASCVQS